MNTSKSKKRGTLSISREAKVMLDSIKHPGQSYSGLIEEIVSFWKKEKRIDVERDK
ncbi:MAG: hypothetical protein V1932_05500 [Chloroflexota bacterium]